MACFNRCCRDLNQYLTPYDILRLKNGLNLSSQQFLDQFTECHTGPRSGLPVVSLKMLKEQDLRCPFVRPAGCSVYEDRPGSCRTYPLGRMAVRKPDRQGCREFYILIQEAHCLGFAQPRQWTVRQWKKDQQLDIYNEMNDLMLDILSLKRSRGTELGTEENELFYMACYDLDGFRDLTFEKKLWASAAVSEGLVEAIREDDVALMRFAIEWIKGMVFGHGS
jgi:Fe-S-cluster containining protein